MKLTKLGGVVARHCVMTRLDWWSDQWAEANQIADEDGDWILMLTERINGLTELRDRFYELQPSTTEDR